MWLNVKWYDDSGTILREDGRYGTLDVTLDGVARQVQTILDLDDPETKIYEAHYGMTSDWARQLVALGYPASMPLSYDRLTGAADATLGDLAAAPAGAALETFRFVINNTVMKDNRIPPYGMSYDEARRRNALPVPAAQYGSPGPGGVFDYSDTFTLHPPLGAAYATVDLLYQPTSWEYIQFLYLANTRQNAFLGAEGVNLLDAWMNTGMAAPYVMASTTWGAPPAPPAVALLTDALSTWTVTKSGALGTASSVFLKAATVGIKAHVVDAAAAGVSGAQVFFEVWNSSGALVTSLQGFSDTGGNVVVKWKTSRTQPPGIYRVRVVDAQKSGYRFDAASSITEVAVTVQ
jgi:hypothetical protein